MFSPLPIAAALLAGCTGPFPKNSGDAVATYARIAEASYADSLHTAKALDTALTALVDDPTAATLGAARQAWLASRKPYLQTEVFRFYNGPIDNPTDGPEGLLNGWPLDENYIDYVDGDPDAGIINSDRTIDAATLTGLNEQGGDKNIATGYHAIEFLLWGQDRSSTGPGDRPATDYATDGTGTASHQARRGTYLTVSGDLLVAHLEQVHHAWGEGADFRTGFEANTEGSIEDILTGMIVLAGFETGGERLQASLDAGDQEEEHSCFSDNTHLDMVHNVQGIRNVWLGTYGAVKGTGIKHVVERKDADLATQLEAKLDEALANANALQPPYDREIAPGSEGNARVRALIVSLRETESLLTKAFAQFGLAPEIPTE